MARKVRPLSKLFLERALPHSIKGRIILVLLVVLIPIFVIQGYMYYDVFRDRREEELSDNLEIGRAVGRAFDGFIHSVLRQELSIGLAATASPPLSAQALTRLLEKSAKELVAVQRLSWVDPNGHALASSLPIDFGLSIADHEYFQEILSGRTWVVGDLIITKTELLPLFTICRAVRDEKGALLGIVLATVDPERLDDVLAVKRRSKSSISVIDRKGMMVYQYPHVTLTWEQRKWVEALPILRRSLEGEELAFIGIPQYEKNRQIMASVPIRSIGWLAGAGRREEEAMKPIISDMLHQGIAFSSVSLLAFLAALGIARTISSPAKRLRSHARVLRDGDLGARIAEDGPSELEELSQTLNDMAGRLEADITERKRVEEALRESEESYRSLVETSPDAIFLHDGELFVYLNPAAVRLFDAGSAEELYGKKVFDFIHPDYREAILNRTHLIMTTGMRLPVKEIKIVRRDGSSVDVEATAGLSYYRGKKVVQVIQRDITERKRAESRVQREMEYKDFLLLLHEKAPQLSDKELYDYVLEETVRLTDSAIGFFHRVSDDQKTVVLTTWNSEALKNCYRILRDPLSPGAGRQLGRLCPLRASGYLQ